MPAIRRTAYNAVTLRDPAAFAAAIEKSGMSPRRISADTDGLSRWKPDLYGAVSHQTIRNLIDGTSSGTSVQRAQALEEALRVPAGTFFVPFLTNQHGSAQAASA